MTEIRGRWMCVGAIFVLKTNIPEWEDNFIVTSNFILTAAKK